MLLKENANCEWHLSQRPCSGQRLMAPRGPRRMNIQDREIPHRPIDPLLILSRGQLAIVRPHRPERRAEPRHPFMIEVRFGLGVFFHESFMVDLRRWRARVQEAHAAGMPIARGPARATCRSRMLPSAFVSAWTARRCRPRSYSTHTDLCESFRPDRMAKPTRAGIFSSEYAASAAFTSK